VGGGGLDPVGQRALRLRQTGLIAVPAVVTVVLIGGTLAASTLKCAAPSVMTTLWLGALAFCVYTPTLLWLGADIESEWAAAVVLYGATFPIWALPLGLLCLIVPGNYGWPHSLLTGAVLCSILPRSRWLGVAISACILVAWAGAYASLWSVEELRGASAQGSDESFLFAFVVAWWNAAVCVSLAVWGWHECRREHAQLTTGASTCVICGYDMRGLTKGICPECGEAAAAL
jgi:hypothetical protein